MNSKTKRFIKRAAVMLLLALSLSLASFAEEPVVVDIGGAGQPTLVEAVAANKTVTAPVVLRANGDITWQTGAGHDSSPFGMATEDLTICAALDANGDPLPITFTATGAGVGQIGQNNGGLVTFKDLKVVDLSVSYNENAWELRYLEFAGNLKFVNVDFTSGITIDGFAGFPGEQKVIFDGCTFQSVTPSEYALWVSQGEVELINSTFLPGTRAVKMHEAYGSNIKKFQIENCTFEGTSEKPAIAIGDLDSTTEVGVKNVTVVNAQPGDQSQYLFESDTDTSNFNFAVQDTTIVSTPKESQKAYLFEDAAGSFVGIQLSALQFADGVKLELFCGDELLTSSSLKGLTPGLHTGLEGVISISKADPANWQTAPWTALDSKKPTSVKVHIDGALVFELEVEYLGAGLTATAPLTDQLWWDADGTNCDFGSYLSDADEHWHEHDCVCGTTAPAAEAHTHGSWSTDTPAEIGKDGLESRRCGICGQVESRRIPALEPAARENPSTGLRMIGMPCR